ncbi:polysaccharide deacetylase family protein [bacterium]|nr:polysaccharide deacetylase family protein [bacterium]
MSPSLLDVASVREYLGRRLLCSVDTREKRLALTFDDGPHPRHTPKLLDLLAAKGLRATFFVVGRRVRRFRDVLTRAAEAGHEIGNHGDHHVPLSILPPPLIRRELDVCGRLVEEITGRRPRFVRPPMGWINDVVLNTVRDMGYEPVLGSIHPQDSRQPGLEVILRRVRRRIEPGAVIILHDGGWRVGVDRGQTIAALDILTDELLAEGYRFETLSELADAT